MIVKRDIVFTKATQLTASEDKRIKSLLSEFEEGSLLTSEMCYYSGLNPFLEQCGIDIRIIADAANVKMDKLPEIDEYALNDCVLRDYQMAAVRKALYWGRGIIQAPTGCHRAGTEILMADGSTKKVEDIITWDLVATPIGPAPVLDLCCGLDKMYEITPVKGSSWFANGDHILSLVKTKEGSTDHNDGSVINVSIRGWLKWPKWRKRIYKLYRAPYDFGIVDDLPLDPYLVGLLLGNGSLFSNISICVNIHDAEIFEYLTEQAISHGIKLFVDTTKSNEMVMCRLTTGMAGGKPNPMKDKLRQINVWGKNWSNKSVPDIYRFASRKNRLRLVAGLIDSYEYNSSGCYDFVSKSRQLSEDLVFVCRSLGLAAYVTTCQKARSGTDYVDEFYRVSISGELFEVPVLLPRKRIGVRKQKKNVLRTGFCVKKVADAERYFGFRLSGEDGRYLLADFTVTHNSGKTNMAAAAITHLFERGLVKRVLYLCPQGFIAEQTGDKFKGWGLPDVCVVGYGHRYKPGARVYVCVVDSAYKKIREESTDLEKVDLIVLDEAHHAKATRWTYICEKLLVPRRLAFTATAFEDPDEYCHDDLVLQGLTGPIIFNISSKVLRDRGYLAHPVVCMLRPNSGDIPVWSWNPVYKTGIVGNKKRNSLVVSLAKSCYQGNYRTMIFVGQVNHGERIAAELSQRQGIECAMVQGNKQATIYKPSGSVKKHKWSVDRVAQYINSRSQAVMIATTVLDEGFDVPTVNVLIMATAMKKYRRTIQRAGRGMRPKEGDNRVFIFDFYDDNHVFLENHSRKRMWTYGVEEFQFAESLDQMQEMMGIKLTLDRSLYYKKKEGKKK